MKLSDLIENVMDEINDLSEEHDWEAGLLLYKDIGGDYFAEIVHLSDIEHHDSFSASSADICDSHSVQMALKNLLKAATELKKNMVEKEIIVNGHKYKLAD